MLNIPVPASQRTQPDIETNMPYYIYKIQPGVTDLVKDLERVEQFDNFKDAKRFVRDKRAGQNGDTPVVYKIIFAENPLEAEEKLLEYREPTVVREWEK